MDRRSYEDWAAQGKKTMKDRIIEKTRDIIANFEGPISKVPEDTKKRITDILQAAETREAENAGAENK
jgi:trimethylamine:corrinoid methyltransferase-like protein